MRVRDILSDVDMMIRNAVPLDTKVRWLNELQDELRGLFVGPRIESSITTVAGQSDYALPAECDPSLIQAVYLRLPDGTLRELRHVDASRPARLWSYQITPSSGIRVVPAPEADGQEIVVHAMRRLRPMTLTTPPPSGFIGLDDEPDLPGPHHSVYVWGLAARIAAAQGDIQSEQQHLARFQASVQTLVSLSHATPDRGFGVELRW